MRVRPTTLATDRPREKSGLIFLSVGVFVAAATRAEVVARLNAELIKVLAVPDVKKRLLENGIDAVSNAPGQFAAYIRAETTKWASVIKDANVKVD